MKSLIYMLFWLRLFGVITDINNTMIISVSIHALLQIILSRAGGGGEGEGRDIYNYLSVT